MDLSGCFGMYEMERAAEIIVKRGEACGWKRFTPDGPMDMSICPEDFIEDKQSLIGFVELVDRGWLTHGTYNGQWHVNFLFMERVRKRIPGIAP